MKRLFSFIIILVMCMTMVKPVYADEMKNEWYELNIVEESEGFKEIADGNQTRGTFISSVITQILDRGDGVVWMRADVHCLEDMAQITTIFYLQKVVDGAWKTVGSATVTVLNENRLDEIVEATNVPDGTYRAKTSTRVIYSSGQMEIVNGYSGSIVVDNN